VKIIVTAEKNERMNKEIQNSISEVSGADIIKCYQCGKCSAGCPLASDMDYTPSYIVRMLQTGDAGLKEKVLRSYSIWLCLTCEMCVSRCPMEIDIPHLMDYLRENSLVRNMVNPRAKKIIAFHKSFLNTIIGNGRLYEIGLLVKYKLKTYALLQDLTLAPAMLTRGKLNILPERIRGRKILASMFKNTVKKGKEPV
jgi:heterodisulfide reductase subunit C2